jgi:hypothetical protein
VVLRGNRLPLGDQESVGGDAQGGVMMETSPAAPFVVAKPDLLLEVMVIASSNLGAPTGKPFDPQRFVPVPRVRLQGPLNA